MTVVLPGTIALALGVAGKLGGSGWKRMTAPEGAGSENADGVDLAVGQHRD